MSEQFTARQLRPPFPRGLWRYEFIQGSGVGCGVVEMIG